MRDAVIKKESDKRIKSKAKAISLDAVKKPNQFRLDWLRDRNWIAVPVPDSIDDNHADALSDMSKESGDLHCYAVSIERDATEDVYSFPMTPSGIWGFEMEFTLQNMLAFPPSLNFAILRETSYYFVVAGPAPIVEIGVGDSLSDARTEFRTYAKDDFWREDESEWLCMTAKRYEPV